MVPGDYIEEDGTWGLYRRWYLGVLTDVLTIDWGLRTQQYTSSAWWQGATTRGQHRLRWGEVATDRGSCISFTDRK